MNLCMSALHEPQVMRGAPHIDWTDTAGSYVCQLHSCHATCDQSYVWGGQRWVPWTLHLPATFPEGRALLIPLAVQKEEKKKE
jgi:hypothetical protein